MNTAGFNLEFSFSASCFTGNKEPGLPNYLSMGVKKEGFMCLSRPFKQSEM